MKIKTKKARKIVFAAMKKYENYNRYSKVEKVEQNVAQISKYVIVSTFFGELLQNGTFMSEYFWNENVFHAFFPTWKQPRFSNERTVERILI